MFIPPFRVWAWQGFSNNSMLSGAVVANLASQTLNQNGNSSLLNIEAIKMTFIL